jgi:3'(2'), 5'-bisphosphate nucleotidase
MAKPVNSKVELTHFKGSQLDDMLAPVRDIARGAGRILRTMQPQDLQVQDDPSGPVTLADNAANDFILKGLIEAFGTKQFAYLSEETYKRRAEGITIPPEIPTWIIDPLDGTREYIQGTGEYAVHIALVQQFRPILAVVGKPADKAIYFARYQGGSFVQRGSQAPLPIRVARKEKLDEFTVVTSRSHRSDKLNQLLQNFPCPNQISVGSLGGKIAAILEHQAEVDLSVSGKSAPKDWDLAAPELVLTEAGGKLTRFDGSVLMYNQEDVNQWGALIASNGTCHEKLCKEATRILADVELG